MVEERRQTQQHFQRHTLLPRHHVEQRELERGEGGRVALDKPLTVRDPGGFLDLEPKVAEAAE